MAATSLWDTRREAEHALTENLVPFVRLLNEVFLVVDDCVDRLAKLEQPFGRICALVLIKARNLGLGCYSLSLDALAQEAGALFRPVLECIELLSYFRLDPTRIDEAIEDRLPKVGIIAQRVQGQFKNLRDYLNTHASHLSMTPDAMLHLIDFRSGQLRTVQPYNEVVLRGNLRTLLVILIWLVVEAGNCVSVGESNIDTNLADRIEDLKRRILILIAQPVNNEMNERSTTECSS